MVNTFRTLNYSSLILCVQQRGLPSIGYLSRKHKQEHIINIPEKRKSREHTNISVSPDQYLVAQACPSLQASPFSHF